MREITITGINAITYPHLNIWDWTIALYLFFGGIAAGLMILGAMFQKRNEPLPDITKPCVCFLTPLLVPVLLSVGMFFIFLDLTRKLNSFWFYLNFNPMSPMSWGAWGVGLIIPLSTLWWLASLPEQYRHLLKWEKLKTFSLKLIPHRNKLATANLALGIFLGIYTGVLLSSFVARPLWNSGVLSLFFLNSGIVSGSALLIIIARNYQEKLYFTRLNIWFIAAEIVLVLLFYYSHLTSTSPHRDALIPFFTAGAYPPFWIAVFFADMVFPIALALTVLTTRKPALFRIYLSAALILLGTLAIRIALVYVGQLSSLSDIVQR
jgi:formate-dependent nitrite reductase membrane component NrfD